MHISYDKLWKLLIDKKMNKQDLKKVTGLSSATIAKLGKSGNVTTDVLIKICEALECGLFGLKVVPFTWWKVLGVVLLAAGAKLMLNN